MSVQLPIQGRPAPKVKSPMRPSDKDTGYLWGKAGRKKAEKARQPRGYIWGDPRARRK